MIIMHYYMHTKRDNHAWYMHTEGIIMHWYMHTDVMIVQEYMHTDGIYSHSLAYVLIYTYTWVPIIFLQLPDSFHSHTHACRDPETPLLSFSHTCLQRPGDPLAVEAAAERIADKDAIVRRYACVDPYMCAHWSNVIFR